jgi:hypothetical protein
MATPICRFVPFSLARLRGLEGVRAWMQSSWRVPLTSGRVEKAKSESGCRDVMYLIHHVFEGSAAPVAGCT